MKVQAVVVNPFKRSIYVTELEGIEQGSYVSYYIDTKRVVFEDSQQPDSQLIQYVPFVELPFFKIAGAVDECGILFDWDKQAFFSLPLKEGGKEYFGGTMVLVAENHDGDTITIPNPEKFAEVVKGIVEWEEPANVRFAKPQFIGLNDQMEPMGPVPEPEYWTYEDQPK